jgi:hypothetical protein
MPDFEFILVVCCKTAVIYALVEKAKDWMDNHAFSSWRWPQASDNQVNVRASDDQHIFELIVRLFDTHDHNVDHVVEKTDTVHILGSKYEDTRDIHLQPD